MRKLQKLVSVFSFSFLVIFPALTLAMSPIPCSQAALQTVIPNSILSKNWIRHIDLQEEKELSGISADEIWLMEANSSGLVTIDKFLKGKKFNHVHYRLGLDRYRMAWPSIQKATGIPENSYERLNIPKIMGDPKTDLLMERITLAASHKRKIVFFVPKNILGHPARYPTANEFEWFIQHPERMKNVQFVFGAYHVLTEEGYSYLSKNLSDYENEMTLILTELYKQKISH